MSQEIGRQRKRWQSESMEWFSGWMFGFASLMLISLVGYIGYQGLATHWPRPVGLLQQRDGQLIASEKFDAHLSVNDILFPQDIWTVERKDDEVLYGFPIKLTKNKDPSLIERISLARVFVLWLEQSSLEHQNHDSLDLLDSLRGELLSMQSGYDELVEISIDSTTLTTEQVRSELEKLSSEIHTLQNALRDLDHQLDEEHRLFRRAARSDETEVDRVHEEVVRCAFELGASQQQRLDLVGSWQLWNQFLLERDQSTSALTQIRSRLDESIAKDMSIRNQALEDVFATKTLNLSVETREAIRKLANVVREIAADQIRINTRLAELELNKQGYKLAFAIPQSEPPAMVLDTVNELRLEHRIGADGFPSYFWVNTDRNQQITAPLLTAEIMADDIVRAFPPNQLTSIGKLRVYVSRWTEFLFDYPRQSGMAGGVFPAIWGTIAMTLLMSVMVVPFGVIAAIYIHEYAEHGWFISFVRITINNLAGVPSVVYGVFGLAFFCHLVGGFVDGGPTRIGFDASSYRTWWMLFGVTLISFVGFIAMMMRTPNRNANRWPGLESVLILILFLCTLFGFVFLIAKCPFFDGLYREALPNATFGKGCLLWASLTLALLTLPVVIVCTEEALAAVPHSLREGSYACGASKWQTIYRLIVPHARPGILTGFILSMARGAGEVAPLMLVGAIPLATDLPIDDQAPFLHGSRSFMHLGFQIYSLGFQSQDSLAAKPLVFSTTLLLLTIVWTLNAAAIWMRSRLRNRVQSSYF